MYFPTEILRIIFSYVPLNNKRKLLIQVANGDSLYLVWKFLQIFGTTTYFKRERHVITRIQLSESAIHIACIKGNLKLVKARIPYDQTRLVESCHQFGRVLLKDYCEDGVYLEAELVPEMCSKLKRYEVQ